MALDFCKDCDQVVEGNTYAFECSHCGETIIACRQCLGTNVVGIACEPEKD